MKREEIFTTWAPPGATWSLWARPVLFAQMTEADDEPERSEPWRDIETNWAPSASGCALVLDVSGAEAVWLALALAGRGFRPVPLYNGCTGPHETIGQGSLMTALRQGARSLKTLSFDDRGVAFLLDSRRQGLGSPPPGAFDNRWQTFPQDFPSSSFLQARGIRRAILVQHGRWKPATDLAHVLRRWQEAGIRIEAKDLDDAQPPNAIDVDVPPKYRSTWRRVLGMLGLRRGPHGGFGNVAPEPSHG